ncbi:hypothetical protein [Evansella tamaricis]|uniref:Uncharacterized protein n=1 Tax=Evansella tamaricis TaxID=2069301 RepID=A0ABS6JGB1_9BACI|nr:hypothetical protein [Evansella tamaricis]MBU9711470.1 hypothetical protein [Evansella tamaricis]
MQRLIEVIFGEVDKDNKFLLVSYWSFVSMYLIILIFSVIPPIEWVSLTIFAVLFPVLFRVVFSLNSLILKKINIKGLLIAAGLFSFIVICFVGIMLFFSDNVAINATKSTSNGKVQLSIDKLKGTYQVAEFDVMEEGIILIPYQATVGEGTISLLVEKESEILWEESISLSEQGSIQFRSEIGTYEIHVFAEEASHIFVEVNNP